MTSENVRVRNVALTDFDQWLPLWEGYNAFYEQTAPGLGRQKDIHCNHVALVDEGRCGKRCAIMDGKIVYEGKR